MAFLPEQPVPTDERITVIFNGNRIVEYEHEAHFAVYRYKGIEGSINCTHEYTGEEQRALIRTMQFILIGG